MVIFAVAARAFAAFPSPHFCQPRRRARGGHAISLAKAEVTRAGAKGTDYRLLIGCMLSHQPAQHRLSLIAIREPAKLR
jgi:hypothetical protein